MLKVISCAQLWTKKSFCGIMMIIWKAFYKFMTCFYFEQSPIEVARHLSTISTMCLCVIASFPTLCWASCGVPCPMLGVPLVQYQRNFSNQQIVGGGRMLLAPAPLQPTHISLSTHLNIHLESWSNWCWHLVPSRTVTKCHKEYLCLLGVGI